MADRLTGIEIFVRAMVRGSVSSTARPGVPLVDGGARRASFTGAGNLVEAGDPRYV